MKETILAAFFGMALALAVSIPANAEDVRSTEVFFGDTHLHTSYSPDAYLMQNRSADPDTAYRYASRSGRRWTSWWWRTTVNSWA
jgi:hypothetical protein